MVFEYELPDVGEGVAEGEIVAWLVEPGDRVEEDQVLAEVETDKAVVDLPSPVNGVVKELHAEAGEVARVGSVVVTLEVDGNGESAAAADEDPAQSIADEESGQETAETEDGDAASDVAGAAQASGRVFAPPHVRRLARELGVDITTVEGSEPGGRVTEGDVRTAAGGGEGSEDGQGQPARTQAATRRSADSGRAGQASGTPAAGSVEAADRDRTLAVPATRQVARELDVDLDEVPTEKTRDGEAFVEESDVRAYAEALQSPGPVTAQTPVAVEESDQVTREPYRGIRRTIGKQMAESLYTAPHAIHQDTAEVSELVEARADLKARAEEKGVKMTYMPFVMKAIVAGLTEYPMLNSELDEENEEILYKHYYNLGVAVATEAGLMVPVVKNVDQKGMLQLASEVNELAERARNRDLTPQEMRDGTFTITNFGAIGGEYASPIINYPEAAILGLGAIEERPVAQDGAVVARPTLPLSLSIDHRVIDGAEGAGFCNTVIDYLENPTLLLLE